jgi:hypothetical protein
MSAQYLAVDGGLRRWTPVRLIRPDVNHHAGERNSSHPAVRRFRWLQRQTETCAEGSAVDVVDDNVGEISATAGRADL